MEESTTRDSEDGPHPQGAMAESAPAAREAEPRRPQSLVSQPDSDENDDGSTQSESTWLSRAQYQTDALRRMFDLPEGEVGDKPANVACMPWVVLGLEVLSVTALQCCYEAMHGSAKVHGIRQAPQSPCACTARGAAEVNLSPACCAERVRRVRVRTAQAHLAAGAHVHLRALPLLPLQPVWLQQGQGHSAQGRGTSASPSSHKLHTPIPSGHAGVLDVAPLRPCGHPAGCDSQCAVRDAHA